MQEMHQVLDIFEVFEIPIYRHNTLITFSCLDIRSDNKVREFRIKTFGVFCLCDIIMQRKKLTYRIDFHQLTNC